jgi:two-component system sensor histidine kinase KdpD
MVEIEVTVADERDVHGLMRRLRGLFDSSEVTYDSERKHVRVRAEWESRTVAAVVDAVKEWMDETGADSASLVVGNRSFTILRPDAASAASTTDDQIRALATIADFVRSAHTAKNSAALLGHACERVSEVFGLARVGIVQNTPGTVVAEAVASHHWPLHELAEFTVLPEVQAIMRDAEDSGAVVLKERPAGAAVVAPLIAADRCDGFLLADHGGSSFALGASEQALLSTLGTIISAFLEEASAHEDLQLAGEFKTDFISLASHELRTPTAAVCGIATTLHRRGDAITADQRRRLSEVLYDEGMRLHRLVDQLLDLSRLEGASVRITPSALVVRERTEEIVRGVAAERADEIDVHIDPALIMQGDAVAFDRIVSNLIINALRYGQPPIAVSASAQDRHFRLAVEDAGPGVSRELEPQLFERFTRGTNVARSGAGLGLSIARSYAHAHGGELLYTNTTPHGARFELVIPIS